MQEKRTDTATQEPNYAALIGIDWSDEKHDVHLRVCERSEEHTSELQSHSFISYAVFCLKKKNT